MIVIELLVLVVAAVLMLWLLQVAAYHRVSFSVSSGPGRSVASASVAQQALEWEGRFQWKGAKAALWFMILASPLLIIAIWAGW